MRHTLACWLRTLADRIDYQPKPLTDQQWRAVFASPEVVAEFERFLQADQSNRLVVLD